MAGAGVAGIERQLPESCRSSQLPQGSGVRRRAIPGLIAAWPLFLTSLILLGVVLAYAQQSLRSNGGHICYPTDDVYLHLAVAKHLANNGVWGVTPFEFSSSISSPLWATGLAMAYTISGVREATALWLALAAAFGLLWYADRVLRRTMATSWQRCLILLTIAFLMPLAPMVVSGMEHNFHSWITLTLVTLAAATLCSGEIVARSLLIRRGNLLFLAALLTATRYEGLFAVAVVAALFAWRRHFAFALALVAAGALPVIVFGLFSISKGWYFLPNSVLLKASLPQAHSLSELIGYAVSGFRRLISAPHLFALVLAALAVLGARLRHQRSIWSPSSVMLTAFLAIAALHVQLAKTGWFFRYEAYLMALGLMALARALLEPGPESRRGRQWTRARNVLFAALLVVLAAPMVARAWSAHAITAAATTNVYEQQYQMGRFLRQGYAGASVAANDIGAINYLADIRCLDLCGLATMDVAHAKRSGLFDTNMIRYFTASHGVRIAIVYDPWFKGKGSLPKEWTKVGEWTIANNKILGGDTVSFYAITPAEVATLVMSLQQFAPQLPKGVGQNGIYSHAPPLLRADTSR